MHRHRGALMPNLPIEPSKLPATLRSLAKRITDFEDERNIQNGYWVHLAAGWFSDITETHIVHEDTLAFCAYLVRDARPCSCG